MLCSEMLTAPFYTCLQRSPRFPQRCITRCLVIHCHTLHLFPLSMVLSAPRRLIGVVRNVFKDYKFGLTVPRRCFLPLRMLNTCQTITGILTTRLQIPSNLHYSLMKVDGIRRRSVSDYLWFTTTTWRGRKLQHHHHTSRHPVSPHHNTRKQNEEERSNSSSGHKRE